MTGVRDSDAEGEESKEEAPDHKGPLRAYSGVWACAEVSESRCVP